MGHRHQELPYSEEVAGSQDTRDTHRRLVHQGVEVVEAAGAKELLLEQRSQRRENRIRNRRHGSGPMVEQHHGLENHSHRDHDHVLVAAMGRHR